MGDIKHYISEEDDKGFITGFINRSKKNPYIPAGLLMLTGVSIFGYQNYKKRGNIPLSLYIMQYRVYAQGAAIACLTLGMVIQMINRNTKNNN